MRANAPTKPLRMPGSALAVLLVSLTWQVAGGARAQGQRRDFMLDFQPEGSFLMIDHVGTGGMVTLEHRTRIYGAANDLTVGTNLLAAYPLGELGARADLRLLFLSIGGVLGYRTDWRNIAFEGAPGRYCVQCDRGARREADDILGDSPGSDSYPIAEARATLYFPINEYLVGTTTAALRHEGRRDRSYDWIYASIYDGGLIGRWEALFFVKHRDWGGIGPYVQLLSLPRSTGRYTQFAYGFNAVTRLGLLRRNDLLFLTALARFGDEEYGQHNYFAPLRALIVYRMIFQL